MMTENKKPTLKERFNEYKVNSSERFNEFKVNMKNPIKRKVYGNKVSHVLVAILRGFLLFGLAFIIAFPILREIVVAIKAPQDLNNPLIVWIPEHFSVLNIQFAAEILDYWNALLHTAKISLFTAILQVFATSLAGYAFARLKFKGSNLVFWLFMLTLIIPPQAVALSRSLYFANFDILNFWTNDAGQKYGLIGLINGGESLRLKGEGKDIVLYVLALFGQGIRSALFIYLFKQFFRGIPVELEESAQIDGAGVVRTFWSVMLPNARGCITTVSLFAFVWQYNDSYYVSAYNINGKSFPLLTMNLLNISEWISNLIHGTYRHLLNVVGTDTGANPYFTKSITSTAALLLMLPLLIGYLFVQRLFIEGVERSGIVG